MGNAKYASAGMGGIHPFKKLKVKSFQREGLTLHVLRERGVAAVLCGHHKG